MSIIFIYFFVSTYRRVFIFTKNKLFPVKWITCSRSPEYVSVRAYARVRARDTPNTRRVGEYETCKKQIRADHSCRRIRVLHYRNKNKIQSF